MKDFFIVAHKYATNNTTDVTPAQLGTKAWHLNDIIKKLALSIEPTPTPTTYYVQGTTLYLDNLDNVLGDIININSGSGTVSSDTLDFDNE